MRAIGWLICATRRTAPRHPPARRAAPRILWFAANHKGGRVV